MLSVRSICSSVERQFDDTGDDKENSVNNTTNDTYAKSEAPLEGRQSADHRNDGDEQRESGEGQTGGLHRHKGH